MKKEEWEKEQREIDRLVAEAHARLPRTAAKCFGAIYARYSSNFQYSIVDQVREDLEYAIAHEIFVAREHVFCDAAVSGRKKNREGLLEMKAALSQRHLKVLIVFTTNRLYRKSYALEQFVEEEIVSEGKRAVFVHNRVDTSDTVEWRMYLKWLAMIDEAACTMYAPNIRAAHRGLFRMMMVCGNITYGYQGDIVPNVFTKRGKPRRRYAKNEAEAAVVRKVFHWFVVDRLPIEAIVQMLNADDTVPPPRINPDDRWTYQSVRGMLENPRYRGWWKYGASELMWQAKQDYARAIPRDEALEEAQWEELRIVTDEVWHAAQDRLALNREKNAANRPKHGNARGRTWILNGLFYCAQHRRPLCGHTSGKYLFCLACKAETKERRPLYSGLPRELAMRLTLKALGGLVRTDQGLVDRVILIHQEEAARLQAPDPGEVRQLQARKKALEGQIKFILRNAGETDEEQLRSEEALKELNAGLREVESQLSRYSMAQQQAPRVPTEANVRGQLEGLESSLLGKGLEANEEVQYKTRELLRALTGGRIEVVQAGQKRKRHGWLQGRFTPRVVAHVVAVLSNRQLAASSQEAEVVIDYKESEPTMMDLRADKAKALYDLGKQMQEIALALGLKYPYQATVALKHWYKRDGQPFPDNRSRFGAMRRASAEGALHRRIAPEVVRLADLGYTNDEIAVDIGRGLGKRLSRDLITKCLQYWDATHGTKYCDRKERYQLHKRRQRPDRGAA